MINMNGTKLLINVNQSFKLKQWHNIKIIYNKNGIIHRMKKTANKIQIKKKTI